MNAIDLIKDLETRYPKSLAYDWDNVGLQVGTLNKPLKSVLITLDVTKEVVKEAIQHKVDLIISHHPLIFKPLTSIPVENPRGWMIQKLIKHDISLYSMHTNYDVAEGGMNDQLCRLLGITNPSLLDTEVGIGRYGSIAPMSLTELVSHVKAKLHIPTIRVIHHTSRMIETVGISGGSGSIHINEAKRRGCDVYITGDVTYHNALDAIQMGIVVFDVGHSIEKVFIPVMNEEISMRFPEITVLSSQVDTNPYQEL